MFKKALALVLVLLLVQTAFSARLVDPINKTLVNGDFLGAVSPGATLELVISKDFGKYSSLTVAANLPKNFVISTATEQESFKVYVVVPPTVALTDYALTFDLTGQGATEHVSAYFSVENNLLDASFDQFASTAEVGKAAPYQVTIVNNSYADEHVTIIPHLPWYWKTNTLGSAFTENTVLIPKRSTKTVSFDIFPRAQGEKVFDTTILFGNSGATKTASLKVVGTPSIKGKLDSALFGLPFYSFSLLPEYLINGLIGYFLQ